MVLTISAEDFETRSMPEPNSGCWLWLGALKDTGYGRLILAGRYWAAHRLSYVLYKGPIPDGLEIDHLCRTRCCVNPDHLEAVTRSVNCSRSPIIRAQASRQQPKAAEARRNKPTCDNGHPRSPGSKCRECERAIQRRRWLVSRPAGTPVEPYRPRAYFPRPSARKGV